MARTSKCLKTWCYMVMIWVMVEFCVVGWLWNFISILPKIQEFLHPWSSRILHQISWDIVGDGCRFGDDASALGDLSRSTARRRAWPRQLLDYAVLLYQLIVSILVEVVWWYAILLHTVTVVLTIVVINVMISVCIRRIMLYLSSPHLKSDNLQRANESRVNFEKSPVLWAFEHRLKPDRVARIFMESNHLKDATPCWFYVFGPKDHKVIVDHRWR